MTLSITVRLGKRTATVALTTNDDATAERHWKQSMNRVATVFPDKNVRY